MGIADDLQQLSNLFERGLLSREQFDEAKMRLLNVENKTETPIDVPISRVPPSESPPSSAWIAEEFPESRQSTSWSSDKLRSIVSDRSMSALSFMRENKVPSVVAGALALLFVVAMFARSAEPTGGASQATPATSAVAPFNVRYESVHHLRSTLESVGVSCTRWRVFDFPGQGATGRADCTDAVLLTIYPDETTARRAVEDAGRTIAQYGLVGFYIVGPNWSLTCGNAEVSCHLLRNQIGGDVVSNIVR